MQFTRRTVLATTLVATTAGCLARTSPGESTEAEAIEDRTESPHAPVGIDEEHFFDEPQVVYIREQRDADGLVLPNDEDERTAVVDFIDETDFDSEALVYIQSIAPQLCYTLDVGEFAVDDGTLTATATTPRTAPDDQPCGDAMISPSALVRLTFSSKPPANYEITVEDGTGSAVSRAG